MNESFDIWLEGFRIKGHGSSTIASYENNPRLHVRPVIGDGRLQAPGASDLDLLYAQLLADGR